MNNYKTGMFLGKVPFARIGDGPNPIVVLNGGQAFVRRPSPERTLRDVKRIARILPSDASLIMLGYDVSPPESYRMDDIVHNAAEILRSETGPSPVVGISYGGVVAARLAAAHPELVTRLVMLASAHDFSAEGRRRVQKQMDCARKGDFVELVEDFAAVFRRPWLNWLLRLRLRSERKTINEKMNDPQVIIRSLQAVQESALSGDTGWLRKITARTLIIGGSEDQFFGEGRMEETASQIPNAELKLFPKETHMVPVERARDVARTVRDFLGR